MQPNTQPTVTPETPAQPTTPVTQPSPMSQPVMDAAAAGGYRIPTKENLSKLKKIGYVLAILSIVLFFVVLSFGYTLAGLAFLGAFGLLYGIKTKTVPLIVLGSIGLVLNLGAYTIAVFSSL